MKFEIEKSFDRYFLNAEETTKGILASDNQLMDAIRGYHSFFTQKLFDDKNVMPPFTALMALNSFMLFLGAVRVSLSGHEAATFPIFRTSLEAACYAFLIGEKPEAEEAWLNRHQGENEFKLCRRMFTSAVKDTAKKLQAFDFVSEGTQEWIESAYDSAINHGAHPNPRSLFPHLQIDKERDDGFIGLQVVGLHSPGSHSHNRSLMACLDYGLLIAVILSCCVKDKSEDLFDGLQRLNDLKEKLAVELFEIEPIGT